MRENLISLTCNNNNNNNNDNTLSPHQTLIHIAARCTSSPFPSYFWIFFYFSHIYSRNLHTYHSVFEIVIKIVIYLLGGHLHESRCIHILSHPRVYLLWFCDDTVL